MASKNIIGIDLGGTNVRAGMVHESNLPGLISKSINAAGTSGRGIEGIIFY